MSRRYCLSRRVEGQVTCSRSAAEAGLPAASGRSWRRLPERLAAVQVQDVLSAPRNLRWVRVGVSASGSRSSDGERAIVSSENAEEDRARSGALKARSTAARPHAACAGLPGRGSAGSDHRHVRPRPCPQPPGVHSPRWLLMLPDHVTNWGRTAS